MRKPVFKSLATAGMVAPGRITYVIATAGTVPFIRMGVPDTRELLAELEREVPR